MTAAPRLTRPHRLERPPQSHALRALAVLAALVGAGLPLACAGPGEDSQGPTPPRGDADREQPAQPPSGEGDAETNPEEHDAAPEALPEDEPVPEAPASEESAARDPGGEQPEADEPAGEDPLDADPAAPDPEPEPDDSSSDGVVADDALADDALAEGAAEEEADPARTDPPPLAPAVAELREISAALGLAAARERPWAALQRGELEHARIVLTEPPPDAATWSDTLRALQARLRRVERFRLSPFEKARADSLSAWLRALQKLELAHAGRRNDPLLATRQVERVLVTLLGVEALPLGERVRLGEAYVSLLPERWQATQEGLTTPVKAWSREACEELQSLTAYLEDVVGPTLIGAVEGERARARLQTRIERAVAATEEFRAWLEAGPVVTGRARHRVDRRALEIAIGELTGDERSIGVLRADLLDLVARDDHGRLSPREARPRLAQTAGKVTAALQAGLEASRQLYALSALQEVAPAPVVEVRTLPSGATPWRLVRLVPAAGDAYAIAFEVPDPAWPGGLLRALGGLASSLALRAEGLRRGPSGEALLRGAHAALPPQQRMPFLLDPFVEGFGLYTLDVATRLTLPSDAPTTAAFERGGARLRLLEAARMLAAIELHALGLEQTEVVDAFRIRTGVALEAAELEVEHVWHEPMRGAAILGYLELKRFEERLALDRPRPDAARTVITAALKAPGLRPVDVAAAVDLPR